MQPWIPIATGLKYFAGNEKCPGRWPINPYLKPQSAPSQLVINRNHLPSCSEGISHFLLLSSYLCLWNTGFCLSTLLFRNTYIHVCQKIISWKFIFWGLSGPLFEDPWLTFLWSKHSSVLAEQERLSLAGTRTGLPKRTKTTCDLPRVTQALALCSLSHSWSITNPIRGCPVDRGGHLPGCQIAGTLRGNYVLLYICWFSALAQENPLERKIRTGLQSKQQLSDEDLLLQSNSDLSPAFCHRAVH